VTEPKGVQSASDRRRLNAARGAADCGDSREAKVLVSNLPLAVGRDKDRLFLATHREALEELLRREDHRSG